MALQSGIPVSFEAYFPRGAFMVGEVEAVVKWSDDGQRQGQDLDKNTGHPLWQVRVYRRRSRSAQGTERGHREDLEHCGAEGTAGGNSLPFRPVYFDGLTVTPYVKETGGRPRVTFSLRAKEMKPAGKPRGGE